ncbi:substrate-binding domain-containing protein [Arhodomonas sp. SL1]|uniref:substrate-binding domain-containing protein n=1 Tax=Arhodomonas sp. SL1 TaxID=3425691 RepID=UPI003F885667
MRRTDLPPLASMIALLVATAFATVIRAEETAFTLASTTSTESSGLFGHLLPVFEEDTGIDVRVVAVGTGQALELGRRGDADALLVHAPAAEHQFIDRGYGVDRRRVMYNDFVVVGPGRDPAGIAGAGSAAEAFSRIAAAEAPFASRGDDSGTHKKERSIWEAAGVTPSGSWYRELGSGMGATLNTAAAMNAYALTDRGSWLSFDNRQDLQVLYGGDEALFNQYGSILVNPERHDGLRTGLAQTWHEWLTSPEGQQRIASFRLNGARLFHPNAE